MVNEAYEGHMANRKVRGSFLLLEQTKQKTIRWMEEGKEKKRKEKKKGNEKKKRKGRNE